MGGVGTGFYLLSILIAILDGGTETFIKPVPFELLTISMVSIGFLILTIEAGRASRSYYLLNHLRHSWISRETLAFTIFVPAVSLEYFYPHIALRILAVTAALILMISQGFIISQSRAVTAWNMPIMPFIFLSSGLASGYGLILIMSIFEQPLGRVHVVVGLICVGVNLILWFIYLRWSSTKDYKIATETLRYPAVIVVTVGLGHILPLILLAILFIVTGVERITLSNIIATLSGLGIIAGVISQKVSLIMLVSYLRGILVKA